LAVGHGVKSCTQDVGKTDTFNVDGKSVVLVDFPGFDDSHLSDVEILSRIADFLSAAYVIDRINLVEHKLISLLIHRYEGEVKITGLLYVHRITDIRFRGIDRRNLRMFREMCGAESLKNVVIVTNMWSQPPKEIELKREAELRDSEDSFRDILAKGAQMVRHSESTRESTHEVIRRVLNKVPVVLDLAKQIVDEGMDLEDTGAGRSLGDEITEALQREREEIERLQADKAKAARENDEKWKGEVKTEEEKANARSRALEEQIRSLRERRGAQRPGLVEAYQENQERFLNEMGKRQQAQAERINKIASASLNQPPNPVVRFFSYFFNPPASRPRRSAAPQ
jgi:hypothetical protein